MRTRFTLLLALSLVAGTVLAPAAMAKESNQADYWERDGWECTKIDKSMGSTWTPQQDYALVVLKSSGDNFEFLNASAWKTIGTTGKDISHIIVCGAGGYVENP